MSTEIKTEHPYIVRIESVCGERPIIKGTRTPVRSIIGYYKLGLSVEEILEGLPHLSAAQIYDAISYYLDHQEEIERDFKESRLEAILEKYNLQKDEKGRLIPKNDIS